MEIIGKEYRKKLLNSRIEVEHFVKVKCSMKTDLTKFIWGKRKCFICDGKFKDGDKPVAAITKKGTNKIICEKCYLKLVSKQNEKIQTTRRDCLDMLQVREEDRRGERYYFL